MGTSISAAATMAGATTAARRAPVDAPAWLGRRRRGRTDAGRSADLRLGRDHADLGAPHCAQKGAFSSRAAPQRWQLLGIPSAKLHEQQGARKVRKQRLRFRAIVVAYCAECRPGAPIKRRAWLEEEVFIPDKLYFRIGEVASLLKLPAYVLRFWETEFPHLKPAKSSAGQRLYRKKNVEMLVRVKHLLYVRGLHHRGRAADAEGAGAPKPGAAAAVSRRRQGDQSRTRRAIKAREERTRRLAGVAGPAPVSGKATSGPWLPRPVAFAQVSQGSLWRQKMK